MLVDPTQADREELDAQSLLHISQQLNSTLDTDLLLDSLIVGALQLVGAESGCSGCARRKAWSAAGISSREPSCFWKGPRALAAVRPSISPFQPER